MDLPVSPRSYQPTQTALIRAIHRAQITLALTVAEETPLDAALAFTNPQKAAIDLANFAAELGPDANVPDIVSRFDQLNTVCHSLDATEGRWAPSVAETAQAQGYRPMTWHVYLLQRHEPIQKVNPAIQIVPARAVYGQAKLLYQSMAATDHGADALLAEQIAQTHIDHLDEPRLEVFVGRIDDDPVGLTGVLTLGQIGVLEQTYADPARRGQQIGLTMMKHLLEHCRRAQFEQILIARHEGCPSIPFYEKLGFVPAASFTRYHRSE